MDLTNYKLDKQDLERMARYIKSLTETNDIGPMELSDDPVSVLLNIISQSYLHPDKNALEKNKDHHLNEVVFNTNNVEYINSVK